MPTRFVINATLVDTLPSGRVRVRGLVGSPIPHFEFDGGHVLEIKNCGNKIHLSIKTTSWVTRTLQAMKIENRIITDDNIRR